MSSTGWFDKFSNTEVKRDISSSGVVYYKTITSQTSTSNGMEITTNSTTDKNILELFADQLLHSKGHITPEIKQIIDDMTSEELNTPWGRTEYSTRTPLGYAIDKSNIEVVDYLLQIGADVNISGPNQKHILQELLASSATPKRIEILEMIIKKINVGVIKLEKNYNNNYYSIKYLIPLINNGQFTEKELTEAFNTFKPKEKKILTSQCNRIRLIALGLGQDEYLPEEIKDMFLF